MVTASWEEEMKAFPLTGFWQKQKVLYKYKPRIFSLTLNIWNFPDFSVTCGNPQIITKTNSLDVKFYLVRILGAGKLHCG